MSQSSDPGIERARKVFGRCKVMRLAEVAEFIRSSIHTARRRLKQWQAANSYNHNGRYYTLPDVPEFDGNGLWRWRGVYFSQYGNLKAAGREPTAAEAVAILVEKIKHPAWSHEALSRQLRKQKVLVEAEAIQDFFLRHGLTVKKTPHSI